MSRRNKIGRKIRIQLRKKWSYFSQKFERLSDGFYKIFAEVGKELEWKTNAINKRIKTEIRIIELTMDFYTKYRLLWSYNP